MIQEERLPFPFSESARRYSLPGGMVIQTWATKCCALSTIEGATAFYSPERIEEVFGILKDFNAYLKANGNDCLPYPPRTYLVTGQESMFIRYFKNHPNVKEITKFTNRAHSGHLINMYLIDFP